MIWFVGAGPGAVDLITVRGQELLQRADMIIYAGSLVNPALLQLAGVFPCFKRPPALISSPAGP